MVGRPSISDRGADTPLFGLRLGPEQRLMRETFGARYDEYATRTKRLVPGVW
jgi:protein-S-isoprenylcysteine O-methyltransferase Ste14